MLVYKLVNTFTNICGCGSGSVKDCAYHNIAIQLIIQGVSERSTDREEILVVNCKDGIYIRYNISQQLMAESHSPVYNCTRHSLDIESVADRLNLVF